MQLVLHESKFHFDACGLAFCATNKYAINFQKQTLIQFRPKPFTYMLRLLISHHRNKKSHPHLNISRQTCLQLVLQDFKFHFACGQTFSGSDESVSPHFLYYENTVLHFVYEEIGHCVQLLYSWGGKSYNFASQWPAEKTKNGNFMSVFCVKNMIEIKIMIDWICK